MSTNLNYSRLGSLGSEEYKSWNNIVLSPTTVAQRNQLKSGMDDFTSFTWRGVNAFDVFGAFIINNKNTLKFYNGPSFSNEYTKPQFESAAGQLVGVSFNVQKIDFTIGVYWISEDDYRKLIDWLDPYEISDLTFGFEPNYYYLVKLASIGDAVRHIVGIEGSGNEKQYMYYTELKLTFEIQGEPCAYRDISYEFEGTSHANNTDAQLNDNYRSYKYYFKLKDISDNNFQSHLAMPIKYKIHLKLEPIIFSDAEKTYTFKDVLDFDWLPDDNVHSIDINGSSQAFAFNSMVFARSNLSLWYTNTMGTLTAYEGDPGSGWRREAYKNIHLAAGQILNNKDFLIKNLTNLSAPSLTNNTLSLECSTFYNGFLDTRLFNLILKNLSYTDLSQDYNGDYYLDLVYDSATGLLYWDRNDSKLFLLSRLSTASSGSRIVDYLESTSYKVLGTFNDWSFNLKDWQIELKIYSSLPIMEPFTRKDATEQIKEENYYIDMRARTNVI